LRHEGYEFDYVELLGQSNDAVLAALGRAHIVLNQFYAFMPGMFGIEALAAGCAVMMSADEAIEGDLPAGSNRAWLVTRPGELYTNLKALLDDPSEAERLAVAGSKWARLFAAESRSGARLRKILRSIPDRG
jgi:hypothetical protein